MELPSSASATFFWTSDQSADRTAQPRLTVPLRSGRRSAVLTSGDVSLSHSDARAVVYRTSGNAR